MMKRDRVDRKFLFNVERTEFPVHSKFAQRVIARLIITQHGDQPYIISLNVRIVKKKKKEREENIAHHRPHHAAHLRA